MEWSGLSTFGFWFLESGVWGPRVGGEGSKGEGWAVGGGFAVERFEAVADLGWGFVGADGVLCLVS